MDFITTFLRDSGIDSAQIPFVINTVSIILFIPIITTLLAVFRYVIGIKVPALTSILLLTFAFVEMSFQKSESSDYLLGLKYGALLYFVVFVVSTLSYYLIKRFRMHYIPKLTLIFTVVSIIYAVLVLATRVTDTAGFLITNTFVIVVIAVMSENIVSSYARKDLFFSIDQSIRTLLFSIGFFTIISIEDFRKIIINFPYIIFILVFINIYIGRFKGLRLTEYFRFKSILLSNSGNEQNSPNTKK